MISIRRHLSSLGIPMHIRALRRLGRVADCDLALTRGSTQRIVGVVPGRATRGLSAATPCASTRRQPVAAMISRHAPRMGVRFAATKFRIVDPSALAVGRDRVPIIADV